MKKTVAPGIIMTVDQLGRVVKNIKQLADDRVLVGIPSTEAERNPDPADGAVSPYNNAQLGYLHENGSPVANIPARPFLIPGVEEAKPKYTRRLKAAAGAALDGDEQRVDRNLHAAGLETQAAVRGRITEGPFVPLAESTLARRRARGRTGEKPLIDTGQLRNSINYVVEKGRK